MKLVESLNYFLFDNTSVVYTVIELLNGNVTSLLVSLWRTKRIGLHVTHYSCLDYLAILYTLFCAGKMERYFCYKKWRSHPPRWFCSHFVRKRWLLTVYIIFVKHDCFPCFANGKHVTVEVRFKTFSCTNNFWRISTTIFSIQMERRAQRLVSFPLTSKSMLLKQSLPFCASRQTICFPLLFQIIHLQNQSSSQPPETFFCSSVGLLESPGRARGRW